MFKTTVITKTDVIPFEIPDKRIHCKTPELELESEKVN